MSMSQRSIAAYTTRRPYDSTPFRSHARSGTPSAPGASGRSKRFIPARAGNTSHVARYSPGSYGSSPRGRGTRSRGAGGGRGVRFIPARAGNTDGPRVASRRQAVHPRAGGEHPARHTAPTFNDGSSPRGRGTRFDPRENRCSCRFIPARAGNTPSTSHAAGLSTVHPRAGGEHFKRDLFCCCKSGSSPRGRGTLHRFGRDGEHRRFIPARAGNTGDKAARGRRSAVHPRAGGEHPRIPQKRT